MESGNQGKKARVTSDDVLSVPNRVAGFLPALASALRPDSWLPGREQPTSHPVPSPLSSAQPSGRPSMEQQAAQIPDASRASGSTPFSSVSLASHAHLASTQTPAVVPRKLPHLAASDEPGHSSRSPLVAQQHSKDARKQSVQHSDVDTARQPPLHPAQAESLHEDVQAAPSSATSELPAESSLTGQDSAGQQRSVSLGGQTPEVPMPVSLQRSISLQAKPQEQQKLWSTPMFPSLESRTQSLADIPQICDPDAAVTAPSQADASSEPVLQTAAQRKHLDNLLNNPSLSNSRTDEALNQAQPIGSHVRRVSFAAPPLQMSELADDGHDHESSRGPSAMREGAQEPEGSEAVKALARPAASELGGQLPADEFEALVAGRDAVQARSGSCLHDSSLFIL